MRSKPFNLLLATLILTALSLLPAHAGPCLNVLDSDPPLKWTRLAGAYLAGQTCSRAHANAR